MTDFDIEDEEPIRRLNRDLLKAAQDLAPAEVRYIVDGYYAIQEYRKSANNQARSAQEREEPTLLLDWLAHEAETIEGQIKRAMQAWVTAPNQRARHWASAQKGIGPVLAAGLFAHFDIERAPTAGHFWSFAGLNPEQVWRKGEKRPWNASLKTLCWKVGDSFVKVSGRPDAVYGQAYRERKQFELEQDAAYAHRDQATTALQRPKLTDNQRQYYDEGRLPPGRLDLRARRWAVKLFLSHLHHVMYEEHYGTPPPFPYVINQMGHTHYLGPKRDGPAISRNRREYRQS